MFEKYELTILDLAFLFELYNDLREIDAEQAHDMLFGSSILRTLQKDSDFVQQQGIPYWTERIKKEWMNE